MKITCIIGLYMKEKGRPFYTDSDYSYKMFIDALIDCNSEELKFNLDEKFPVEMPIFYERLLLCKTYDCFELLITEVLDDIYLDIAIVNLLSYDDKINFNLFKSRSIMTEQIFHNLGFDLEYNLVFKNKHFYRDKLVLHFDLIKD